MRPLKLRINPELSWLWNKRAIRKRMKMAGILSKEELFPVEIVWVDSVMHRYIDMATLYGQGGILARYYAEHHGVTDTDTPR